MLEPTQPRQIAYIDCTRKSNGNLIFEITPECAEMLAEQLATVGVDVEYRISP